MNPKRTALMIRCSLEEAERIRAAAKLERRTVSGYILNAVINRTISKEKLRALVLEQNAFTGSKSVGFSRRF